MTARGTGHGAGGAGRRGDRDGPVHDVKMVVRGLAYQITDLVARILPDGKREGHEWVAGPSGGRCRVHLTGAKAGIWAVFASGEKGDALDLVAWALYGGDKKAAYRWALNFLGLDTAAAPEIRHRIQTQPTPDPEDYQAGGRERARKLYLAGQTIRGTPVDAYLAGRGIRLDQLGRVPGALRFHPATWCTETDGKLPAMLALIQRVTEQVAVHRTYLAPRADGGWAKAPLQAAKKVMGNYKGGFIPIWRGAGGHPMADHDPATVLCITEGIEDALTIALHQPDWRVVAAVSISNMAEIILPPAALDVVLAYDRDGENPAVRMARAKAERVLLEQGRSVRTIQPEPGFKDFNDWHQALARGLVTA